MERVDLLLTNAFVVTMDDEARLFPEGAVALKKDSIVAVGPNREITTRYRATETVDCGGKTLIPGLINAHTHAPMTLLRGLADDRRLDVWLLGYMMPVERAFVTPEFCRLGTRIACAEMIRSGITCFADMYYFEEAIAQATNEIGLRAVCAQTVLKFPTPDADSYEDSLASARRFIEDWREHPLIVPAVAPHAPYTCTPEILRACAALAVELDVPLHVHLAETKHEVEAWRESHGMPVVPWIKKQGLLEAKLIAAHCVHLDEGELHTLRHAGAAVAHNPSSNLKLASGFAPVKKMLDLGIPVGVGTDGAASNNDLDLFEEMRLATLIAKAVTGDPTALPARVGFAMATRLGARALYVDHLTGSIEPGKRADLVLVEMDGIHQIPHFAREAEAVYSRLVYSTKSSDVNDVMVNGRWLMRNRELLTVEEAPLVQAARAFAARVDLFLEEREDSVLSKLVAIGGAEQEESYEVQVKVRLAEPRPIVEKLGSGNLDVLRSAHYRQYDSYFFFLDPTQGRLRYREDQRLDDANEVAHVRYRLTLTHQAAVTEIRDSVFLYRSRFIAPAKQSARFYREYFKPVAERVVHKDRRRWLVRFQDLEFFVNVDDVLEPPLGHFLEVKSRTWSRRDAEQKAAAILELLQVLGVGDAKAVQEEYPDLEAP